MTRHRPKPELVPRTCLLWHMADADCSMSDFHLGGREGGGVGTGDMGYKEQETIYVSPPHASSICTCGVRPDSDLIGGRSH